MTKPKNTDRGMPGLEFPAGHSLIRQGDFGDYLIRAGLVSIQRTVGDRATELGQLGPGRIFGELALITAAPRLASAIALDQGRPDCFARGAV